MSTIIDGILSATQNRHAKEESLDADDEPAVFVLGGDRLGASIARRLRADGHSVGLIDETRVPEEVPGLRGDPGAVPVLQDAGVAAATTVVVATPDDGKNLLVAQLVRAHFDVGEIIVLVHAPDRYDLVADAGHEPVCATTALTDSVASGLEDVRVEAEETA